MFGFIGFLNIEQTLLLWDRIIGFENGLELLSVLAASVFTFHEERLMNARTEKEVQVSVRTCSRKRNVVADKISQYILSDLSELKVIPLIQYKLFFVNNA